MSAPTDPDATDISRAFDRAADAVRSAGALVVAAGAGMGVDSGLPDFRGPEGFWRAYPMARELGLRFEELANPAWFAKDPTLAWGFYGHRHHLYRDTAPHRGFEILRRWGDEMPRGAFVFTSNIDGHFQRAGFDDSRVVECHGSLERLQCVDPCGPAVWRADEVDLAVEVDEATLRAAPPLPRCPHCGGLARPNVLMFGDWLWVGDETSAQESRFRRFLESASEGAVVVVELGAGTAVPTVRRLSEALQASLGATLVRINPREPEGPAGTVEIPRGALQALEEIDRRLAAI